MSNNLQAFFCRNLKKFNNHGAKGKREKFFAKTSFTLALSYFVLSLLFAVFWVVANVSLHKIIIYGWNNPRVHRIDNISVADMLDQTGIRSQAKKQGISIVDSVGDLMNPGQYLLCSRRLTEQITSDLDIALSNCAVVEKIELQKITHLVEAKQNSNLLPGQKRLLKRGSDGEIKSLYWVIWQNGRQMKKRLISSTVSKRPVTEVVERGAVVGKLASRGGNGSRARAEGLFTSTAYTHTGNRTACGKRPHKGIVAVDPKVIPLGTQMYIEGYGYAIAGDTGGAIKGRKLDLFFETRREALSWGRRKVKVTMLQ